MKKRGFVLLLVFALCLSMMQSVGVSATEKSNADTTSQTSQTSEGTDTTTNSKWALDDLLLGDSYGIYPLTWYETGLTNNVSKSQMEVLVTGLTDKLRKADGVTAVSGSAIKVKENMKVKDVLRVLYAVVERNNYSKDLELYKYNVNDFMKVHNIYTGTNGELGLNDKCTVEQACVIATRLTTYVYDVLDAGSKGFFWKIQSGNNTAYLLGSIHLANNDIYPFSKKMLDAYSSSEALIVEVNLYNQDGAQAFNKLLQYTDGTTLKDHVSPKCYQKVMEIATALGIPKEQAATYKAWYLSNYFTALISSNTTDATEASKATALGIDMSFMSNALFNDKTILEIEGYEKQGKMFDDFSDELQDYLLNSSVDEVNKLMNQEVQTETTETTDASDATMVDKWLDAWQKGDINAFKDAYNVKSEVLGDTFNTTDSDLITLTNEYYNALLTERDKGMANYIENMMKKEGTHTYFVVVGSLHFLSDYSVLDILKEKGYVVSQMK